MPVKRFSEDELPAVRRRSRLSEMPEWKEIQSELAKGIKPGDVIQIIFSPETIKLFEGKNAEEKERKAAFSFTIKLRNELNKPVEKYRIQLIGGIEIRISNKEGK